MRDEISDFGFYLISIGNPPNVSNVSVSDLAQIKKKMCCQQAESENMSRFLLEK